MARINVNFGVVQRTSAAGNDYYLIEMRTTDKDGQFRELPDVKMTPFTARLLLEHLPELCESIKEGERQKREGGPPPQAAPGQAYQGDVVAPSAALSEIGGNAPQTTAADDTPF